MAAISGPWNDVSHKVGVDPATDAQAQRDRSLEHDAENRVGALLATNAVTKQGVEATSS